MEVLPEVYSAAEIALAAGVNARDVVRWGDAHDLQPLAGGFYSTPHAVRMVRHLLAAVAIEPGRRDLFQRDPRRPRRRGVPIAITTALHMGLVAGLALMTTAARPSRSNDIAPSTTQLVFLAMPGPGGGGGGGGRKALVAASAAQQKGVSRLRSPIPMRPVAERPAPTAADRPAPRPQTATVVAPVVPVPADTRDTTGEPVVAPRQPESPGPGAYGEAGSGGGNGIGSGSGPGLGAGANGGAGGGPYRPGSGINPPSLVREVKPDYTEEARRRNMEGEVELEIVVRSDGSVGDVTLLRGLGAGLDQRAVDAVRQWRFVPATRQGVPVDVVVQVSVEFRLR